MWPSCSRSRTGSVRSATSCEALGESQPKVSNHLAALRTAGLIASRREHRTVRNGLAGDGVAALVAGLAAAMGLDVRAVANAPDAPAAPAENVALDVAADPEPPSEVAADDGQAPAGAREFVVFVLGGGEYGLPIADVREIVRYTPPRRCRGRVRACSGSCRCTAGCSTSSTCAARSGCPGDVEPRELVVVDHDGRSVAMPVEAIRQVVSVRARRAARAARRERRGGGRRGAGGPPACWCCAPRRSSGRPA